ncbi:ribosomal protein S18 acetylase RimI-like enzyme [Dysgonomonas sp. PFB1-18]|uniref:GNAT family N-acetyltransferase n=1 Tax=unclassified Dysgonomonas TaxID=2630389 RepID=UPI002476A31C|nr:MULTISPECIES: GNAT family N-acetyltransferase [unclassified Dysgonomonas]MDH6308555.1 ribosomal protein S18 acetylase RimI-like enzyme [Dysgonomonas sp. PF1-14]MDH6338056.1 ribosomal protein S18 acetylase RimI-like enzyme [Dysgonomonas sp. PF1-16]MDH6379553.1 ribosomal protein S18 acetylase RimI-like enzyme [Dysgonomonas sp. PFB1-18]MDH6396883.1 ribosomal protein S18 acetylase RimI-like enzyme [Dysgonomonas sp. PF1-23]
MKIKTLSGTSIEQITRTFNQAFSDYFVPIVLTMEQLQSKMKADNVNLDYSVGVFDNEELIAFILHGTDVVDNKHVVYNGGTGVIPTQRGQGLTKQMYEYILPVLKDRGIDYLVLEVISKNIQAIKSYEKTGYTVSRMLKCYKGKADLNGEAKDIEIKSLSNYDWVSMQSFRDFIPTWQNSMRTAEEMKATNKSFGAYADNQLTGYIIYNPNSKRIQQIAVHKDFRRRGIASALISVMVKDIGNEFSIVNIDDRSEPINSFLRKIGLENYLDQLEMKLELK